MSVFYFSVVEAPCSTAVRADSHVVTSSSTASMVAAMIIGKQIHAHEVGPAMRALVIRYHAAPRHNDSLVRVELVGRLRIGNERRVHDRD
jgi:hypothetical protein